MKKLIIWSSIIVFLLITIKYYESVLLENILLEGYDDNHFVAEQIDIEKIKKNRIISNWINHRQMGSISLEYSEKRSTVTVVLMEKFPISESLKIEFEKALCKKIVKFGTRRNDGTVDIY